MNEPSVRRSESVKHLAAALSAAQAELKNPAKNKQNPHFKNWYADLAAVIETVLPVLTRHKLSVTQMPCELGDDAALMTVLMHESGEWIESVARLRPVKNDPQGVGSAQSYMRRYSLMALAGVAADDDDDGHAASRPQQQQARPQQQPPAYPSPRDQIVRDIAGARSEASLVDVYRKYESVLGTMPEPDRATVLGLFKSARQKFQTTTSDATN